MEREKWEQVKDIFDAALQRTSDERERFLAEICQGDDDLRREVESLLSSFDDASGFLQKPAVGEVAEIVVGKNNQLTKGQRFSHYEIIRQIGAGGMGEVYLAEDIKLHRRVALKVLPEHLSAEIEANGRLLREAQAAATLDHPHICAIHEISEAENCSFIVMQYVEGKTLAKKLAKERLSIKASLDLAIQIADALEEAHTHNIIHRDIKPANIIVNDKGQAKVLDFGLAKFVKVESEEETAQMLSKSGAIMGTVPYMSPEQLRGGKLDGRTDIFSFGAMFYEMLGGRQPFTRENNAETISAILNDEPHWTEIPAHLQSIVRKSLAKNKTERYQTVEDLARDLRALQQSGAISNATENRFLDAETAVLPKAATEDISQNTTEQITSWRRFRLPILAALILILFVPVFFVYRYFSAAPINSIAVMPFVNAGQDAQNEYLSDGITENLINNLSQIPKLKVMSRNTVFRYKGKETDAQKVGKELSVGTVLMGNVKQVGDQLLINVELIDVKDGARLWGNLYTRKVSDIITTQNEIAREVVGNLRLKLSEPEQQELKKRPTENPEAYQIYLKGRFFQSKGMPQDLQKAIEYFQQAIALDPNFALAYAGLAYAYAPLSDLSSLQPRELMLKAKEAALHALSLDDQLVEAHTALGYILFEYDYDFAGAEREFKRAIELNPNDSDAHRAYGELLTYLGRREASLAELRRALEIDPLSLSANCEYGRSLSFARRYDEAITQLKRTLELDNSYWLTHYNLAITYNMKGDYAESVAERVKINELFSKPQTAALMRESFAKGGWQGFLRAMTSKQHSPNLPPYIVATFYVELGEKDKALAILNQMYEDHNYDLVMIKVDPRLDPLRDDPRFIDLMRRMNFE